MEMKQTFNIGDLVKPRKDLYKEIDLSPLGDYDPYCLGIVESLELFDHPVLDTLIKVYHPSLCKAMRYTASSLEIVSGQ